MKIEYADVKLINARDLALAKKHIIGNEKVKSATVNMRVNTGNIRTFISEKIRKKLRLPIIGKLKLNVTATISTEYNIVGPIEAHYKDQCFITDAIVLPADSLLILADFPDNNAPVKIPNTKYLKKG